MSTVSRHNATRTSRTPPRMSNRSVGLLSKQIAFPMPRTSFSCAAELTPPMKSVYGQWLQRGRQSLNSLLMKPPAKLTKLKDATNWDQVQTALRSVVQQSCSANRKQMRRRRRCPDHSATPKQSVYGQCPPRERARGTKA